MEKRLNWLAALRIGWRTGFVIGVLVGFQEGFLATTVPSGGATNVPLTHLPKLMQVFFTPIFAEALGWGILLGALSLLLHLVFGRRFLLFMDGDRFVPFFSGLAVALATTVYSFVLFNPTLRFSSMITPTRAFFNVRLLLICLFTGTAVGFLIRHLRQKPIAPRLKAYSVSLVSWLILLTTPVIWVNRIYLDYSLDAKFFGVLLLFLAALVLLTWITGRFLARRYMLGPGRFLLTRHQVPIALALLTIGTFAPLAAEKAEFRMAVTHSSSDRDLNVILVSVDTLRADRLSCYQSDNGITPNIDRLADEGVLFTDAQSQSAWTLASIGSILTSLYPTVHGVDHMMDPIEQMRETLPEKLSEAGFMTGAVVSNGWLLEPFGASQGFQVYDHMKHRLRVFYWSGNLWWRVAKHFLPSSREKPDPADSNMHLQYAFDFLEANRDNNFFFWLHVIDPHEPYVARGEWAEDAGKAFHHLKIPARNSGMVLNLRRGMMLSIEDRLHVADLYRREVEYTDQHVGRFLDRVYEMGLTKNTMIIFTSDHGEEFWDHGDVSHGHTFFRELVNVPLIIRPPDGYPVALKRIDSQVRLIDLAPTILDFLGLTNLEHAEGTSLLPIIRGEEEPVDRPAYYEAMIYYQEKKGYCDGRYKYILSQETGEEELYDLKNDPDEERNIALDEPELKLELKGKLLDHMARQQALADELGFSDESAELDADTRAHLRALGYIQ